jgi:hypothetical protein
MRSSYLARGLSGRSSNTSVVVLPQQFSNYLRARDERMRLVCANLMMTGPIFSGDLDTDIVFDYAIFTPACLRDLDARQPSLRDGSATSKVLSNAFCTIIPVSTVVGLTRCRDLGHRSNQT